MKLVTVREAADFLRISYRTAQRYLAEGRMFKGIAGSEGIGIGKVAMIKEQDLMNFVNMTNR